MHLDSRMESIAGWEASRWIARETLPWVTALPTAPTRLCFRVSFTLADWRAIRPVVMTLGEADIVTGTGSQTSSFFRWGDYTSLSLDPTDDQTFWHVNEWVPTTSVSGWVIRVGSFKIASAVDTVTISKAQYSIANSQLKVNATDSNPAAVLTVKVTSSGEVLGTMQSRGDGTYQLKKVGIANPVNITVTSNLGGSASKNVQAR